MAIIDQLRSNRNNRKNRTITLTDIGRQRADSTDVGQGTDYTILCYLADNGASNVNDIARNTGIAHPQIERTVKRFVQMGWARHIDSNE